MSLPPYLMGQQGYGAINWQPAQQGVENILARLMKRDQMQQETALQQQRMGMEQERLGFDRQRMEQEARLAPLRLNMEQQRLDAAREDAQFNRLHRPMQLDLERERLAGTREELSFKRGTYPIQQNVMQTELDLKRKALEAEKFGRVKDNERLYVQDPSQPGGIRWLDSPGEGGPGQKKFAEEAAKQAAERYAAIIKHGDTQPNVVFDLLRLQELSNAIGNPNAYNSFVQKYGGWMKSVGMTPGVMPSLEQFSSLVSKMAPNLRPPGSGATSDFDIQQYINSLPQFMQTAEGRKAIIDHQRAVAAYAMQQKSIAQQVMLGNLTREQGEQRMNALPDPHAIWKQMTGRTEANAPGGPAPGQKSVPTITNPADAKKLPKGQRFIYNGQEYEVQ